ncbi:STAS-like domain-containing protein [Xanthobacter sp.]|uniref:STAS-like domain-containing protein n=1 Tax=Xanthobacter sp. TaxID=35809 RepID=UPI0035B3E71B
MRSDGNRIIFDTKVQGDPLPITASMHNIIKKQGYLDVTLDFSNSVFLFPSVMIPLIAMCCMYRSESVDFSLVLPIDQRARKLIINTNWAHFINPSLFGIKDDKNASHMAARNYRSSDEQFKAVDDSLSTILNAIEGLDRRMVKALEWSLNEITDNVLNHASSEIGGIVQVMVFPKKRLVEFFVCDAGVTIPKSLRSGRPELENDVSALRAAIEEGVTRNKFTNQGNGLFGTFKCCEVSGGEFDLISGNVALEHKPGTMHVRRNPIPFSGTYVRAAIGYGYEKILEKAFIFKGRQHEISFDYIERMYINGDHVEFIMKKEVESFGSRDAGKFARNKIENLMDGGRMPIEFDFTDIVLISSSFADEVFGRLFIQLGALRFGQLCRFKGVDSTIQALIDRAITQRMRA